MPATRESIVKRVSTKYTMLISFSNWIIYDSGDYLTRCCHCFLEKDECTPNPCRNNAKCVPSILEDESQELEMNDPSDLSYVCICPAGYTGKLCETGKKFCSNHAGLKITVDTSTVKMTDQLNFSSVKICF